MDNFLQFSIKTVNFLICVSSNQIIKIKSSDEVFFYSPPQEVYLAVTNIT